MPAHRRRRSRRQPSVTTDAPGASCVAQPAASSHAAEAEADLERQAATLFVGDVARTVTEEQLAAIFGRHGHVAEVVVKRDKATLTNLGYAFVTMGSRAEARAAKRAVGSREIAGRRVRLGWAQKNSTLAVSRLPDSVPFEDLVRLCEGHGPLVAEETFLCCGDGGKVAYVRYRHRRHAEAARAALAGAELGELRLAVAWGDSNVQKNAVLFQLTPDRPADELERALLEHFSRYGRVRTLSLPPGCGGPADTPCWATVNYPDTDTGFRAAARALRDTDRGLATLDGGLVLACRYGHRAAPDRAPSRAASSVRGAPSECGFGAEPPSPVSSAGSSSGAAACASPPPFVSPAFFPAPGAAPVPAPAASPVHHPGAVPLVPFAGVPGSPPAAYGAPAGLFYGPPLPPAALAACPPSPAGSGTSSHGGFAAPAPPHEGGGAQQQADTAQQAEAPAQPQLSNAYAAMVHHHQYLVAYAYQLHAMQQAAQFHAWQQQQQQQQPPPFYPAAAAVPPHAAAAVPVPPPPPSAAAAPQPAVPSA